MLRSLMARIAISKSTIPDLAYYNRLFVFERQNDTLGTNNALNLAAPAFKTDSKSSSWRYKFN